MSWTRASASSSASVTGRRPSTCASGSISRAATSARPSRRSPRARRPPSRSCCRRATAPRSTSPATRPGRAREEIVRLPQRLPPAAAPRAFLPHLFSFDDADAAQHLFRVAAGLDSLVVGEPQILGQVKDAFQAAAERHCTGPLLSKLFHWSFGVGKRVRTRDGARRRRGVGQLRRGGAGAQDLRPPRRPPRARGRRRRNQHADRAAPARAGRRRDRDHQPHRGACRGARGDVGGTCRAVGRPSPRARHRRHRHHRHRIAAADHHARAGRGGDRPAPPRSAVHHRHRRAARRRGRRSARSSRCSSTTSTTCRRSSRRTSSRRGAEIARAEAIVAEELARVRRLAAIARRDSDGRRAAAAVRRHPPGRTAAAREPSSPACRRRRGRASTRSRG